MHMVHQDVEHPARLVFVEQWSDHPSLQTHFDLPASQAFLAALLPLATSAPSVTLYQATPLSPP